ncbi:MAG: cytidylate kinase-like family protein [SAR324 cluster bacterium]|nr:cytidylate kinase-like family protein [SAR324 cluster bacterium]MBF0351722.1 cytidylate kinase-like family protein [SAR324 cluster bacterium]
MSGFSYITPNIEQQLQAWHSLSQNVAKEEILPTIAISREFGCEGYPLADILEKKLSAFQKNTWIVLSKDIMNKIAEDSGYSTHDLEKIKHVSGPFNSMISSIFGKTPDQYEIFQYTKKTILHVAKQGHAILVGRGAACLTQDMPNVAHFRLVAPKEFRIQRVMKQLQLNETDASKYLDEHQIERTHFVNKFTGKDVTDPTLYDLVLNNGRNTPEQMADIIVSYLKQKKLI